jgi:hypothetical protein
MGRLPTCYSPVRRFTHGVAPTFSLDLHVLGAPLAFALSQDQTLHLNPESSIIENRNFDRLDSCYLVFKEQGFAKNYKTVIKCGQSKRFFIRTEENTYISI